MSYLTAHGSQQSNPAQHVASSTKLGKQPRTSTQNLDDARLPAITVDLTEDEQDGGIADSQDTQHLNTQARNLQSYSANAQATSPRISNLIPFPRRPGARTAEELAQEEALIERSLSSANSRKPGSLDTPSESYKYAGGKCADFNPWVGGHPEDILSEQTIKGGFQNKPAVTNETNTARPSLWNHLKSKQGTGTLSSLFVAVLEKRQAAGKLSASSTFKLPPRVTLTGTRREAWLADLANPAVPLRKLSRTIPHGVNGKVLLEQCLSKLIPAPRAIWLIKCVGANELRAFKRKGAAGVSGASGEAKWTREWTCHVEQFIESILSTCGEPGWSDKIQYVIRLAVNIFNERLLDQDHYLSWILDLMQQASPEHLPFWVIMAQIHWKHIVATRKHGKRLAESLVSQLDSLSISAGEAVYTPLTNRLRNLLLTLAVAHKGCLLSPTLWQKFSGLMQDSAIATSQEAVSKSMDDLTRRNTRLDPQSFHKRLLCKTPRHQVFQILDSLGLNISINSIVTRCRDLVKTIDDFCKILLEWASSIYRIGLHRLYVVTQLLRRCKTMGACLEDVIFEFALYSKPGNDFDFTIVTKIVAELVRSEHFSVAKFLQLWISSGIVCKKASDPTATEDIPVTRLLDILRDVPLKTLPKHVGSLADILLSSFPVSKIPKLGMSNHELQHIISRIQKREASLALKATDMSRLTSPQKHEISSNVRLIVQAQIASPCNSRCSKLGPTAQTGTEALFIHIRAVLEAIEDFPILADTIGMLSSTAGSELLASLADTLNMHHTIFASIGALRPLMTTLRDRYQALRHTEACAAETIRAVLKLTELLDAQNLFTQQLRVDLARQEQSIAIAMCSPASDNLAEHISNIDTTPEEEIERILTSGTSMDQPNMVRVFKRLASYALDRVGKPTGADDLARVGDWLSRLQSFDRSSFDTLMFSWVKQLLASNQSLVNSLLPYIIGNGCCTIVSYLQAVDVVTGEAGERRSVEANLDLMEGLFFSEVLQETTLPDRTLSDPSVILFGQKMYYRAKLESRQYIDGNIEAFLKRLASVNKYCQLDTCLAQRSAKIMNSERCRDILMSAVLENQDQLSSLLQEEQIPSLAEIFAIFLDRECAPKHDLREAHIPIEDHSMDALTETPHASMNLQDLLRQANELSLSYRKTYFNCLFAKPDSCPGFDSFACQYLAQLPEMMHGQCSVWADLLISFRPELKQSIQRLASTYLTQKSSHANSEYEGNGSVLLSVQDLLSVVDCCYDANSKDGDTPSRRAPCPGELLNSGSGPDGDTKQTRHDEMIRQLTVGIHLTVLYPPTSTTGGIHDERVQCIIHYAGLLRSALLQHQPALLEQVFDLLVTLSDEVTEEQRLFILRHEAINAADPRIKFILGTSQPIDNWLGLVTSASNALASGPLTPSAIPSPITLSAQRSLQQARRPIVQSPAAQATASHLPPRPSTPLQRTNSGLLGPQQQTVAQGQAASQHHHHGHNQKAYNPPIPYTLRRWEILPDQGAIAGYANLASTLQPPVNDTSISLTLFGARKVI